MTSRKKQTSIKSTKGFLNPGISDKPLDPRLAEYVQKQEATLMTRNGIMTLANNDEDPEKEVVEVFLEQPDFDANDVDKGASTKSNFYLLNNNWVALVKYLKNLKFAVKYVFEHLQSDTIVNEVIQKLQTNKPMIPVAFDMPVTASRTVVVNEQTYKITRLDDYIIKIECLSIENWMTDKLMVQVKNNDYVIVYPRIKTAENMIEINFVDKIATNYMVFFL